TPAPLLAVALSRHGAIGVDVEGPRAIDMPPRWTAILADIGDGDPRAGWTRVEALGKARGHGVGAVLQPLRGPAESNTSPRASAIFEEMKRAAALELATVSKRDELTLSVAFPAGGPVPRCAIIGACEIDQWRARLDPAGN
ncbi:MAG: hypothetical protein RL291_527, partial [Pseudomonadota bacterium]